MSMEFMFAVIPFERDGRLEELHNEVPEFGDFAEHLKDGVRVLETEDEKAIPSPLGLSLNWSSIDSINRETGEVFLEFTVGDMNGRYILLGSRREALDRLRAAVSKMGTEFRRKFLEVFVRNADAALERYGNRAAIIIL